MAWEYGVIVTKLLSLYDSAQSANEDDAQSCYARGMYIVAIAWLYVTLMMSITEASIVAGVLTFLFYGLLPCALLLWIIGTPQRHRNRLRKIAEQPLDQHDGANSEPD